MSADYQAIQWNRFKSYYDLIIILAVLGYIGAFLFVSFWNHPSPQDISPMILIIRALGSCAFLLLHFILIIGPLARLSPLFKPLLYNRRHLGISMFIIATLHIFFAISWYHSYGILAPLISLFISNPNLTDFARFPFEVYGFIAYLIIMVMALTSHDFWLKLFSPPVWKLLHMGVYIAYGLLMAHVLFGFVQAEKNPVYLYVLIGAGLGIAFLHLIAALKELRADKRIRTKEQWVRLCPASELENNSGRGFTLEQGDKVAVFRYDTNRIAAVANACAHQNGPLCEGRVINGRIVCPWHGYEYFPASGQSPPPFSEKIPTYNIKINKGDVFINQQPNPPGTPTKPAVIRSKTN